MDIQQQLGNTVIMITHDVDEAVLLSDRIVMMTNGPAATIGEILAIELPRPRDRVQLAQDPDFNAYRQSVLRFLYEKHLNPSIKEAPPSTKKPVAPTEERIGTAQYKSVSDIAAA